MATTELLIAPWQIRPVFISSTFKDMQAERDFLRLVVFPRVEEELRKGRLLLEMIDLRQGVETADLPSEEAREQLVLKVCLEEIQRSRPFLIVLLGDRYGWVPPEERMTAAAQEAGFVTELRDKSVTALEIEFGILKQPPDQRRRCFFYFRDPLPYALMPENIRGKFSDEFSPDLQTQGRHTRLHALKQSLAADPELAARVHSYRADWDLDQQKVVGLDDWGEMVYQQLIQELEEELHSASSQPSQTWEEQERASLVEFIEQRRRDFVGRTKLLADLTDLAGSKSPADAVFAISGGVTWGACVTGEAGSGKSALFAELVANLHMDDSIVMLSNAAGATPRGSSVEAMLDRFIQELADVLGVVNPLPNAATPEDVDAMFASLLSRVAATRRVVVFLDALNQFEATPRGQHLTWLRPRQWPANARLIATALPSPPADALSQWAGIEELEIPPLAMSDDENDDVTMIARAVWQRYHRQVNHAVFQVLKQKRTPDGAHAAGNPLWLTLALDQINLLDSDDFARAEQEFIGGPAERLRAMLIDTAERMPPTVAELYGWLLAQTEKVLGVAPARAFAALIAVSRFGWRETDLLRLIPKAAGVLCPGAPLPKLDDLRLAALRRSFRAHLARRGLLGQLDFFHAQMRCAVAQRVFNDHQQIQSLHRTIADHLESLPAGDPLRDSELMIHLIAGDDSQRAARVYADLAHGSPGLAAATHALAQHILLESEGQTNSSTGWIEKLLGQPGLTDEQVGNLALRFDFDLDAALSSKTKLLTRQSIQQAAKAALEQLAKARPDKVDWQVALSFSYKNLGHFAKAQGLLPEAQYLFGECHGIRQRLAESDPNNVERQQELWLSFLTLSELAREQGDLPELQRILSQGHLLTQRLTELDPSNAEWQRFRSISFERLSNLAIAHGNLAEVEWLLGECHHIRQRLAESNPAIARWQQDLANSFEDLGELAEAQGDFIKAQRLLGESNQVWQRLAVTESGEIEWQRNLAISFGKLGGVTAAQGNLLEAQRYFDECQRTLEQLAEADPANFDRQRDLCVLFERLGRLVRAQGNMVESQRFLEKKHKIRQRLAEFDPANAEWQSELSHSFASLGDMAAAQGKLREAWRLFGESLRIAQQLAEVDPTNTEWQCNLAYSRHELAMLARQSGDEHRFSEELRECFLVLNRMNQRGLYFGPELAQLYQQLASMFGDQ